MITRELRQGDRILSLLQEQHPGYHPLIGLANIAHSTDDERLRFDCHKVLSNFIEPTLKAVEVSTAPPESERLIVIFEDDTVQLPNSDGAPAPSLEHIPSPVDEMIDGIYKELESTVELRPAEVA